MGFSFLHQTVKVSRMGPSFREWMRRALWLVEQGLRLERSGIVAGFGTRTRPPRYCWRCLKSACVRAVRFPDILTLVLESMEAGHFRVRFQK